jgi:nucleotide-binding universal stress UspA family protein
MTPAISRILVATDFSASADAALAYALKLADQVGATVRLVHVFEDPDAVSLYSEVYVPMPPELRAKILADIGGQLTARATATGHSNITTEVLTGATAQTIVVGAAEQQCDLIVMGTHGRHGMAHLLMGSVAERVVRTAACPVLVVPTPATK